MAKTPSQNKDQIVEHIDMLVGNISAGEELLNEVVTEFDTNILKPDLITQIVSSGELQTQYLQTTANMLVAIAGYLYGEKGINLGTGSSELLSKVKNNAPILGEKSIQEVMAEDASSVKSDKDGNLTFLIELKGISGHDLQALRDVMDALMDVADADDPADIETIVDVVEALDNFMKELGKLNFSKFDDAFVDTVFNFNDTIYALNNTNRILAKGIPTMLILDAFKDSILGFPKIIAEFISGNNGKGGLVMVLNRITKAQEAGLEPGILKTFFEGVLDVMKVLTKITLFAVICGVFGAQVTKAMQIMVDIVEQIKNLDIETIRKGTKTLETVSTIVTAMRNVFVGLALIGLLALPAIIGLGVMFLASKVLFIVVNSVVEGLKTVGDIKDLADKIKKLGLVFLILGVVMIIAALTGKWVAEKAGDIMMFALVFAGFTLLMMLPFVIFGKFFKEAFNAAEGMVMIIVTCALVMMLGALFMLSGLWKESLLFGAVLAGFMMAVFLPFMIFGKIFKSAMKNAKEMALLIVTCALVMMLGAFFMKSGLWLEALMFGGILMVFMMMVLLPFVLMSMFMKKAIKGAKQIMILIITCALVMMLGAFFMMSGLWLEALTFGAILAVFIFLVVLPFGLWGKNLQKAMPAIVALAILVVISSIVLMIGANYIREYGAEDMIIFATILAITVGILGVMCVVMGKFMKDLLIGALCMAIIVGITMLGAIALKMLAEAAQIADLLKLLGLVGIMVAIIIVIAGLSVALGLLATNPFTAPFFWAGLGAMVAVAAVALIFSKAIKNIAEAIAILATVEQNGGINTDAILNVIGCIPVIGSAVASAGAMLPLALIKSTSIACLSMAVMISMIGNAVADISNLIVGTKWDKDGNAIEFRQLNETDFTNAASNIEKIITTVGGAIVGIYTKCPELFEAPMVTEKTWWGGTRKVSGKKSKFQIVCEACSSMGTMISLIGKGVAEMADMKIATAWNNDGKPTEFRHLNGGDFSAAAKNIQTIITTVGGAIIDIYSIKKEMFEVPPVTERTWWGGTRTVSGKGPTVFEKVVNACSSMGTMITMIASGVRDFATMSIATKWNSDGKPIEYRKLTDAEIGNAIKNIHKTILTLFHALMTVYNWDPKFFDIEIKWENGIISVKNPVYNVIRAATLAGRMVSSLAQGVSDIANLKVATKWNKDGVAIDYRYLKDKDFDAYAVNVSKIIFSTLGAIGAAYYADPALFDSMDVKVQGLFWSVTFKSESPVSKVIKAAQGAGALVSELAGGVQSILDLHLKDDKGKKIPINIKDLQPFGKLYKIVKLITTGLINALDSTWSNTPSDVTEHLTWFRNVAGDILLPTIESMAKMADQVLKKFNNDKIISSAFRIAYFADALTAAMNALYKMQNVEGVKAKLDEFVSPIIISLSNNAKLVIKHFSNKKLISATLRMEIFTFGLVASIKAVSKVNIVTLQLVDIKIKKFLYPITFNLVILSKILNKAFANFKVDYVISTYAKLIYGLFAPFKHVKTKDIIKFKALFNKRTNKHVGELVQTINSLNTEKVDKFIELSRELKELSTSVGDMNEFVEALNGKINETLNELSEKLEYASKSIKESDKAQDKRQKLIVANTRKLEKVLDKPMKIELSKAESSGSSHSSSDNPSAGAQGTNDTPAAPPTTNVQASDNGAMLSVLNDILRAIQNLQQDY